jgi:hypothetical protein
VAITTGRKMTVTITATRSTTLMHMTGEGFVQTDEDPKKKLLKRRAIRQPQMGSGRTPQAHAQTCLPACSRTSQA